MLSRYLYKLKDKSIISFIILLILVTVIYFYLNYLQQKQSVLSSGEHCVSELTSVKYQLNEVTEYKNRIDKLLTEAQLAHKSDKERFKDILESCVAMKHQSAICERQFEDLQGQCKQVREDYNKLKKRLNV